MQEGRREGRNEGMEIGWNGMRWDEIGQDRKGVVMMMMGRDVMYVCYVCMYLCVLLLCIDL
jgi:hypothetical protein